MVKRSQRLQKFLFFMLILLLIGVFFISVASDNPVEFSDPILELEVRTILNNFSKPIYQSELLGIIELDLGGKEIKHLTGLEYFRNLEVLNLENNHVADVSPLATLSNLRVLNLRNNGITDLNDIQFESITHLRLIELYLDDNVKETKSGGEIRLSDISLLNNFRQIAVLGLSENHIHDISALEEMRKLRILDLRNNRVQHISYLWDLRKLEELDLSRNKIEEITALGQLTNLTKINIRDNKLKELSALENLKKLEYLNLHSNGNIQSVNPLGGLSNLRELILEDVPVGDQFGIFTGMENLIKLNVNHCDITDFSVLGELMSSGALQNEPEMEIMASVSIRGNVLLPDGEDPLASIRPWWENIEYRDPWVLPQIAGLIDPPQFSQTGGFYTEALQLTLSVDNPDLEIYYTLDGSEPNPDYVSSPGSAYQITHKYSKPIEIKSRAEDENVYSLINTTHVENDIKWSAPKTKVFKGSTVRAITYDPEGQIKSPSVTHTYFVDENIIKRYQTLPILSLTGDYDVLFDPNSGILNTGAGDNPFVHSETRVPANIEFFEPDGSLGFNSYYEIKLHGFTSVANPQKGLHVYAEPWLGQETIDYPIFEDSLSKANELEHFNRFIIRAWGTALNWEVFFSDAYHQTLMANSDLDIQAYRPAVLFINGEYWGLYELREANKNSEYFQAHYFEDEDVPVDILELGTVDFIEAGDPDHWFELLHFLDNNDIRVEENYSYLETQMDIDNFIQYVIHCIYTGKMDWPGHNEAMWRPRTVDGKWRWIQFDLDQGLRAGVDSSYDMVNHVINEEVLPHPLLTTLLKNNTFKNLFINTFADLINTTFLTAVEMNHFTQMSDELEPYIPEFFDRWGFEFDWQENKNLALEQIEDRRDQRIAQIVDNFGLSGSSQIKLSTDTSMGNIAINRLVIDQDTIGVVDPGNWTGTYFNDIPVSVRAIPKPGYRFFRWESSTKIDQAEQEITIILHEDISLKAIFEVETE